MNKIIFVWIGVLLMGCGGKRDPKPESIQPTTRTGRPILQIDKTYADLGISLDNSGVNAAFLSGREPHAKSLRAYRYVVGTDTSPVRMTAQDDFEEIQVAVSPDGLVAAIVLQGADGVLQLRVQDYDNQSVFVDLSTSFRAIEKIIFDPVASRTLAYIGINAANEHQFVVQAFAFDSAGNLVLGESGQIADFAAEESQPIWVSNGDFTGILTVEAIESARMIHKRVYNSGVGFAAREPRTGSILAGIEDKPFVFNSRGITFSQRLNPEREIVPENNGLEDPGVAYIDTIATTVDLGATSGSLWESTKQYDLRFLGAGDNASLLSVGHELFLCHLGDSNFLFSALTFLVDSNASSERFFLKDNEAGGLDLISGDYCNQFDVAKKSADQNIDSQIEELELAKNVSSNNYKLLASSWHNGDTEVYHLSFTFDGNGFSNFVYTDISQNRRP